MHFTQSVKRAADDIGDAARRDIRDAKELSADALDKAGGRGSFRDDVQPAIDGVARSARDVTDHARERALEASDQVRDRALDLADRTSLFVIQKPLQSLAIAAAAGALMTLLLGKRR